MPRTEALYQPPLVIIPKSPGPLPEAPKAYLSTERLAFSQIYYGYSCAEHSDASVLAALLYLIPHSMLFRYWLLMLSASLGADRMMFIKEELDTFAFPNLSELSSETKRDLVQLAGRLESGRQRPWSEINAHIFRLYGLDEGDVQTIEDTLFSAAVYRGRGRSALHGTGREHRDVFIAELTRHIEPFFDVCGEHVAIVEPSGWTQDSARAPWFFLAISRAGGLVPVDSALMGQAMEEANRRGASRILIRAPGRRGTLLGLLNQRRYWTRTRAMLCAQHIIHHALAAFGLRAGLA